MNKAKKLFMTSVLGIALSQGIAYAGQLEDAVDEDQTLKEEVTKHRANERISFLRYTKGTRYLFYLHKNLVFLQIKYNEAMKAD